MPVIGSGLKLVAFRQQLFVPFAEIIDEIGQRRPEPIRVNAGSRGGLISHELMEAAACLEFACSHILVVVDSHDVQKI